MRFSVKPGITGLAQISGRNAIGWDERLALDVEYVRNWSLWLDLKILIKTIPYIFIHKDIAVDSYSIETCLDEERAGKSD